MSSESFIYRRNRDQAPPRSAQELYCKIKKECQSCAYINEAYDANLKLKYDVGLAVLREAGVLEGANVLTAHESPKRHQYRSHAKLAVRSSSDETPESRFAIGLFQPGSHNLVDLSECPVHAEGINEFISFLRTALNTSELTPYDESTHTGDIRYLVIRRAHLTGAIMLTFVVTSGDVKRQLKSIIQNVRKQPVKLASVHMNINSERGNAIFAGETQLLFGAPKLREGICGLTYEVSPTAFFQVNPWAASLAYRRIEQLANSVVPDGLHTAWDLFCGVGQISLILARLGYQTLGIEENEQAIVDAKHNASLNSLSDKVSFLAGRTEDVQQTIPASHAKPELIVVNPSRKGIPAPTVDFIARALSQRSDARLIYMSCDVNSLSRDLTTLRQSHGLRLRQIEAFDLFAYTDNLEWLAVLTH